MCLRKGRDGDLFMNMEKMDQILDIGIALSAEKDIHVLLNKIIDSAMTITNCDGGTLYLKKDDTLVFTIMANKTLNTYQGGDGQTIDIPSVPLDHEHISSLALLEDKIINIPDAYDETLDKVYTGTRAYDKKLGYHTTSVLVVPMKNPAGEKIGVLQLINALDENKKPIPFSKENVRVMASLASQAAVAIQNVRYLKEIRDLFDSYVQTSVQAIGKLTPFNENHTRNMVEYGRRFLNYLNKKAKENNEALPYEKQHYDELITAIWLHDLGKLVTPVDIMNKNSRLWPLQRQEVDHRLNSFILKARIMELEGKIAKEEKEKIIKQCEELSAFVDLADINIIKDREEKLNTYKTWIFIDEDGNEEPYLREEEIHQLSVPYRTLTDEEFEIMHDHVVKTDELLSQMAFPKDMSHVRKWASMHHELLNGRGYPEHLKAEDIPQEVRILTILDIFEALTAADRDYKKPKTPEEAIGHLHKIAGFNEVDEDLVTLFEESRCWQS